MPPTTGQSKPSHHVLLTGYGPFSYVTNNPSWRAVAPLHNAFIQTPSASIHVTAVGPVKVTYSTILSLVPGLHARPPRLPSLDSQNVPTPEPVITPPAGGYDFVFHVGAGLNGHLALEQVGHKSGYRAPGVDGELAPVISTNAVLQGPSAAEKFEVERLRQGTDSTSSSEPNGDGADDAEPIRGFAKGYECFPEELRTEVDVPGVIEHLKQQGETRVKASTDAGHFLCDFICYGSLAESQRPLFDPTAGGRGSRRSKSLFMHVPYDVGEPHTVEEMTEAVRQIVAWVCTKEKALPLGSQE